VKKKTFHIPRWEQEKGKSRKELVKGDFFCSQGKRGKVLLRSTYEEKGLRDKLGKSRTKTFHPLGLESGGMGKKRKSCHSRMKEEKRGNALIFCDPGDHL